MREQDEEYKPANFAALGLGVLILFGVLGGAAWLLSGGSGGRPTGEVMSDIRPAAEKEYSQFFSATAHSHDLATKDTLVVTYATDARHVLADVEVAVTIRRKNDVITGGSGPQTERWGSLRPGETREVKTTRDVTDPVVGVSLVGTGARDGNPVRFFAEMRVRYAN